MIKNFLAFFEAFALVDRFLIKSSVEPLISMILENGEIQFCLNACLLCRFNQKFVVLA